MSGNKMDATLKKKIEDAFKEIRSGALPAAYPMTERGLIDYHRVIATRMLADINSSKKEGLPKASK